ncbi:MAG TPA: hypothetical protein VIH93_07640, partial [Thermoanaerobaculia bacterium]
MPAAAPPAPQEPARPEPLHRAEAFEPRPFAPSVPPVESLYEPHREPEAAQEAAAEPRGYVERFHEAAPAAEPAAYEARELSPALEP